MFSCREQQRRQASEGTELNGMQASRWQRPGARRQDGWDQAHAEDVHEHGGSVRTVSHRCDGADAETIFPDGKKSGPPATVWGE